MKPFPVLAGIGLCTILTVPCLAQPGASLTKVEQVTINDPFWSPRLTQWRTITANDVLNKFEARQLTTSEERGRNNVFTNFDAIAKGKKGTGQHAGLPWFDGLIYETIRGLADYLKQQRDPALEQRLDGYIERIAAAQHADREGYINTYTDLVEPTHRWGDNGGMLRFQHDVYNAGMLVEAGVHYYKATGKTRLLEVATRFANHMCNLMGPAPQRNIVPAHSGPEEALVKLYWLYKHNPGLKKQLRVPVNETAYYNLARFWIENRGNHCGYPLWQTMGNPKAEQWIKDQLYKEAAFGPGARPSWGDYAQDSISVFKQHTIEGHAVRATLLATGLVAVALESKDTAYSNTAMRLWNNMIGQRLFVTGGVGAIHDDEKFGADYFLPTDAYLETCAAVGAGFFSQRMNELTGDARYMDEFERVLYNNVLTGISLSGTKYTYQNPLNAHNHSRWDWHSCPCCPPMFLKLTGALPEYIYATSPGQVYINLFIGSKATINSGSNGPVTLVQETSYPWKGNVIIKVEPTKEETFLIHIRIPGWARGQENPFDLYRSNLASSYTLYVNGRAEKATLTKGYAVLNRKWTKGDRIELRLPVQPRVVTANEKVAALTNQVAIAAGPVVYCLEGVDNAQLASLAIDTKAAMKYQYRGDLLQGVNAITGAATDKTGAPVAFTAVPYYAAGNRVGKG